MEPVRTLTAVAAPLLRANIDTDAIIPSREMKTVGKTGLAAGLFSGWRYTSIGGREPNPQFVLNRPEYSGVRILLGGENFGCGSSREHAVWALHEFGIRAVIAPSFSPIFFGNCIRNGIVPARVAAEVVKALADEIERDPARHRVTVDVEVRRVSLGSISAEFPLDAEARDMLLEGLDAIDRTLKSRELIEAFWRDDRSRRPWIYLDGSAP